MKEMIGFVETFGSFDIVLPRSDHLVLFSVGSEECNELTLYRSR